MYAAEIDNSEISQTYEPFYPSTMRSSRSYHGHVADNYCPITTDAGLYGRSGLRSVRPSRFEATRGRLYNKPIVGSDVVVCGVSGRFPDSENVEEFAHTLFGNDIDLSKKFNRMRLLNSSKLRLETYKLLGIDERQFLTLDPKMKLLLQVTYEAIFDSGFTPVELKGTNTGVFIGTSGLTTIESFIGTKKISDIVSHCFDVYGPSYTIDTSLTTGLVALDNAINAIKSGLCESAIVGGINLTMEEKRYFESYMPMETLRMDGECVSVVFLQKRSIARRVYAKIVHSKSFVEMPLSLNNVYTELNIEPSVVSYLETHGVKYEQQQPLIDFYGRQRTTPFFMGVTPLRPYETTVSGLISLIKMIVSIQSGIVSPHGCQMYVNGKMEMVTDIHKYNPFVNGGLMALNSIGQNGSVHVVLQPHYEWLLNSNQSTSFWNKDLTNLSRHPRLFAFSGRSEDELSYIFDEMHRTPTDLATHFLLSQHSSTTPLTHPIRGYTILNGTKQVREIRKCFTTDKQRPIWFVFSGMGTEWTGMGKELMEIECFRSSIYRSAMILKPFNIDLVKIINMTSEVMPENVTYTSVLITAIQIALLECLKQLNIEPEGIIGHSFGELVAAYADGCLTNEETLLIAYYRGKFIEEKKLPSGGMAIVSLPWEELHLICPPSIVPAYFNSKDSVVVSGPKRAIVQFVEDLKYRGIFSKLIESSDIPLHSYLMSPVIPHFKSAIENIIRSQKQRTSRWISTSVPECKWETELFNKYITADYFVNNMASPVYFEQAIKRIPTNAITIEIGPRSVLKKVLLKSLGEKLTLINLMKHDLSTTIPFVNIEYFWDMLGKMYTEGINIDITKLMVPLNQFNSIYPVPVTTRFLSPFIYTPFVEYPTTYKPSLYNKYNMLPNELNKPYTYTPYTGQYYNTTMPFETVPVVPTTVPTTVLPESTTVYGKTFTYEIDISKGTKHYFLTGHQINGKVTYPTSGYLYLVWKSLAKLRNVRIEELPVTFENIEIHRPTVFTTSPIVKFLVTLDYTTGRFEIFESKVVVASGRIYVVPETDLETFQVPTTKSFTLTDSIAQEEIYRDFKLKGFDYTDVFRGITKSNIEGTNGEIFWTGKWVPFLETMIQMHSIGKYGLSLPTYIKSIRIDPRILMTPISKPITSICRDGLSTPFDYTPKMFDMTPRVVPIFYDPYTLRCISEGVVITGLSSTHLPKPSYNKPVVFGRMDFMPNFYKRVVEDEYLRPQFDYRTYNNYVDTYMNECKYHLVNIMKKYDYPTSIYPTLFNKAVEFSKLPMYNNKFLELLKEMSIGEKSVSFSKYKVPYYNSWQMDNLVNRDIYLKDLLDTVYENVYFPITQTPKLKVIEISPSFSSFGTKISQLFSTHPELTVDYHYLPVGEFNEELWNEWKSNSVFPINKVEWNILKDFHEIPSMLNEFDLVIFNGSLASLPFFEEKNVLKNWMNKFIEKVLKRDGFFMVHEYTNHFETLNHIRRLEQLLWSEKFLNKEFINYKYQTESEWLRFFEELCGFNRIAFKSDSILSTMMLYRKPRYPTLNGTLSSIVPNGYEALPVVRQFFRDQEIYINEVNTFNWIEEVKTALNDSSIDRLWLICEQVPTSGIIGMITSLRREIIRGDRIRCVFIADTIGKPWRTNFETIKRNDLVMNVYKGGYWGAYRYTLVDNTNETIYKNNIQHAHLNLMTHGDLSTLSWVQSPEPYVRNIDDMIVKVCYAGLNHRDVMMATRKIKTPRFFTNDLFGMEFSGIAKEKRFMGVSPSRSLTTSLIADSRYCWEVPREWTYEQAATVPLSYSTAYYAMVLCGNLKRGDTIFVQHAATPFGQACIAIGLQYECKIFVTIETPEERDYLMTLFPMGITEESFVGYNKDIVFEKNIMRLTYGHGVDVILNTFVNSLMDASVRCLSPNGRFIDMSHYNLSNVNEIVETPVPLYLKKSINYKLFNIESLFEPENITEWLKVHELVEQGIRVGVVRPIRSTIFDRYNVQDAFKHVISYKPINKILIKLWEPKETIQTPIISAVPRVWFTPYHTYVITEGLGLFGMELVQWMVQHGARKIMITSKYGIHSRVYLKKLQYLQEQFGAIISVTNYDVSKERDCVLLIKEACELSEEKKIGGVFHLSTEFVEDEPNVLVVPTPETYKRVMDTKYMGAYLLDKYTRNMENCYFVVLNTNRFGKSTYNYVNSAIDRLCETRRQDGKRGVFISFGTTGESLFSFNEEFIPSELSQHVETYLKTLEYSLLKSETTPYWSFYIPEDQFFTPITTPFNFVPTTFNTNTMPVQLPSLYDIVVRRVEPRLVRLDVPLIEFGLEKSVLFELKQVLEQYYQVYNMDISQIQHMTLGKLQTLERIVMSKYFPFHKDYVFPTTFNNEYIPSLIQSFEKVNLSTVPTTTYNNEYILPTYYNKELTYNKEFLPTYTKEYIPTMYNKEYIPTMYNKEYVPTTYNKEFVPTTYNKEYIPTFYNKHYLPTPTGVTSTVPRCNYLMPKRCLEKLNSVELTTAFPVIVIHPIEGHVNMLKSWAKHMKYPVYGMQFTSEAMSCESIESLAEYYWSQLQTEFKNVTRFHLTGYSFGASVAYEMALKNSKRIASLSFLDGSYSYVNSFLNPYQSKFDRTNMHEFESECLYTFINQYTKIASRKQFISTLLNLRSLEERIRYAVSTLYTTTQFTFDPIDVELAAKSFVRKMVMAFNYRPKSLLEIPELLLIKPTYGSEFSEILGEDYNLKSVYNGNLRIFPIEGDQRSFLEPTGAFKVASILNEYLTQYSYQQ